MNHEQKFRNKRKSRRASLEMISTLMLCYSIQWKWNIGTKITIKYKTILNIWVNIERHNLLIQCNKKNHIFIAQKINWNLKDLQQFKGVTKRNTKK